MIQRKLDSTNSGVTSNCAELRHAAVISDKLSSLGREAVTFFFFSGRLPQSRTGKFNGGSKKVKKTRVEEKNERNNYNVVNYNDVWKQTNGIPAKKSVTNQPDDSEEQTNPWEKKATTPS